MLAAGAAVLLLPSSAGATVRLVRLTSPVTAGSSATLEARVSPLAVRCSITVTYKSGPSRAAGLGAKRPNPAGRVSWTWRVGAGTTPGRWPIVVSCAAAGTLRTSITVTGRSPTPLPPPAVVPAPPVTGAAWVGAARAALARLPIRAAASMLGYRRSKFGRAWADVNGNGCDTRNDILRRDLVRFVLVRGSRCVVQSGTLHDPYTGKTIRFVRGVRTSLAVQIDHIVALGNAWRTGAASWTAGKRLRYANDPVVLLAVDGPTNGAKRDSDASQWLPPRRAFRCRYVAQQITIKAKYGLWVTRPEHQAMARVLALWPSC